MQERPGARCQTRPSRARPTCLDAGTPKSAQEYGHSKMLLVLRDTQLLLVLRDTHECREQGPMFLSGAPCGLLRGRRAAWAGGR